MGFGRLLYVKLASTTTNFSMRCEISFVLRGGEKSANRKDDPETVGMQSCPGVGQSEPSLQAIFS